MKDDVSYRKLGPDIIRGASWKNHVGPPTVIGDAK
jgi:hypothetical protein